MASSHRSSATDPKMFSALRGSERNQASWVDFCTRYSPLIAGVAHRMGVRGAAREDIVQDILLAAVQHMERFEYDPSKSFRGWLRRCTQNHVMNWQRAEKVRRKADPTVEAENSFDVVWEEEWKLRAMEEAHRMLRARCEGNPKRRLDFEAFDMVARLAVPAKEVARELGIDTQKVYDACKNMRGDMRDLMQKSEQSLEAGPR